MSILASLGAWLRANPLFAVVLWTTTTSAINWLFDFLKLHESDSKVARAIDAVLAFLGVDAQGLIKFLRALLGAPPTVGGGGPSGGKGVFGPEPPAGFVSQDQKPAAKSLNRRALSKVYVTSHGKRVAKAEGAVIWLLSSLLLVLPAGLALTTSGCSLVSAAVPTLNKVITYVTDLELVLKGVEGVAAIFFQASPNPDLQSQFFVLDNRVHDLADVVVRLADAGKDIDSVDMQASLSDLQQAYADVEAFLSKAGIPAPGSSPPGKVGTHYQRPLVMALHLQKR